MYALIAVLVIVLVWYVWMLGQRRQCTEKATATVTRPPANAPVLLTGWSPDESMCGGFDQHCACSGNEMLVPGPMALKNAYDAGSYPPGAVQ